MHGIESRLWLDRAALALLAVVSCAALLGGCIPVVLDQGGGIERIAVPSEQHPEPSPAETGTPPPAMVGAMKSAGSWRVTVVRARVSAKGPGGAKAGSGKRFLLIETEFRNAKLDEALRVRPKDVSLKSASGKKIAAWGTASGYNARGMRDIGPGYGGTTTFVYKIPVGSTGHVFTFAPKVDGTRAKLQWAMP